MAINVSVQYNGGLLPDIILLSIQCTIELFSPIDYGKKWSDFFKQTATVICLMVPHQIISSSKVFTKAATMAEISGVSFAMRDACYEPKLPA